MKKIFLILTICIGPCFANAQSYEDKLEIVKLLEGRWEGNLNYLNFQDDKTRGIVELQITGTREGDAVSLQYTYYNNGEIVREGSDKVVADHKTNKFNFNDNWDLDSFEKLDDGSYKVVLSTTGRDNNKKALMRKTVNISESEFTITRDIKYLKEEDSEFFNRHVYSLKKK